MSADILNGDARWQLKSVRNMDFGNVEYPSSPRFAFVWSVRYFKSVKNRANNLACKTADIVCAKDIMPLKCFRWRAFDVDFGPIRY